jgi:hypothetical protein
LTYIVLTLLRPSVHSEVKVSLRVYIALESDVSRRRILPALAGRHVGDARPCNRVLACGLVGVGGATAIAVSPCIICQ